MKPKILIADDSLTIQKVIKITLSTEEYELIECLDDKNLIDTVSNEKPNVVLLDFNLSESKVGYDLAKEIQAVSNAKIMMMYGTFDTIEESLLSELGIEESLVKPFDGNKFIASCRRMIEESTLNVEEDTFPDVIQAESLPEELSVDAFEDNEDETLDDENWVVNQPDIIDEDNSDDSPEMISKEELNHLEAGIQDWGMSIPDVIGEPNTGHIELPPVIAEEPSSELEEFADGFETVQPAMEEKVEEVVLPNSGDLEYPDLIIQKKPQEIPAQDTATPTIELTPINELNDTPEIELNTVESTPLRDGTDTEEGVKEIEELIADEIDQEDLEVEDDSDEDLWKADEEIIDENLETEDFDEKIDTVKQLFNDSNNDEEKQESVQNIDITDLEDKLQEMIAPMVDKIVRDQIQKTIDKVSWEVIPDLAENLIKKELSEITKKLLNTEE